MSALTFAPALTQMDATEIEPFQQAMDIVVQCWDTNYAVLPYSEHEIGKYFRLVRQWKKHRTVPLPVEDVCDWTTMLCYMADWLFVIVDGETKYGVCNYEDVKQFDENEHELKACVHILTTLQNKTLSALQDALSTRVLAVPISHVLETIPEEQSRDREDADVDTDTGVGADASCT